jgi:hypothetical protein
MSDAVHGGRCGALGRPSHRLGPVGRCRMSTQRVRGVVDLAGRATERRRKVTNVGAERSRRRGMPTHTVCSRGEPRRPPAQIVSVTADVPGGGLERLRVEEHARHGAVRYGPAKRLRAICG